MLCRTAPLHSPPSYRSYRLFCLSHEGGCVCTRLCTPPGAKSWIKVGRATLRLFLHVPVTVFSRPAGLSLGRWGTWQKSSAGIGSLAREGTRVRGACPPAPHYCRRAKEQPQPDASMEQIRSCELRIVVEPLVPVNPHCLSHEPSFASTIKLPHAPWCIAPLAYFEIHFSSDYAT